MADVNWKMMRCCRHSGVLSYENSNTERSYFWIIDKYSKISIKKWNDFLQENNKQYSKIWRGLDAKLLKNYVDGNIEFLSDEINWIYPRKLFKDVKGKKILCFVSGGGQQSVAFNLLGVDLTVCDISIRQLELDKKATLHYRYEIKQLIRIWEI